MIYSWGNIKRIKSIKPEAWVPKKNNICDPIKLLERIKAKEIQGKPYQKCEIKISVIIKYRGMHKILSAKFLIYLKNIKKNPKIILRKKINKTERKAYLVVSSNKKKGFWIQIKKIVKNPIAYKVPLKKYKKIEFKLCNFINCLKKYGKIKKPSGKIKKGGKSKEVKKPKNKNFTKIND